MKPKLNNSFNKINVINKVKSKFNINNNNNNITLSLIAYLYPEEFLYAVW